LELTWYSMLTPLLLAHHAIVARHAVVEEHHVVLNHAQPLRFGVFARSRRILRALQRLSLSDVASAAIETGFLVVPENESNGPLRLDVGTAQDARQLHHKGCARPVIVGGLSPAVAVHMGADDVHLVGAGRADLAAVHLFPRPRRHRLRVELSKPEIGLRIGIGVHAGGRTNAARAAAANGEWSSRSTARVAALPDSTAPAAPLSRRRLILVLEASDVRAAIAFELGFDPGDRRPVTVRPLPPIPELRQPLDRGFVSLEIKSSDQRHHGVVGRGILRRGGWCSGALGEGGTAEGDDQTAHRNDRDLPAHGPSFHRIAMGGTVDPVAP
jgi:hypothetical protein